jgi:hypothetical protein
MLKFVLPVILLGLAACQPVAVDKTPEAIAPPETVGAPPVPAAPTPGEDLPSLSGWGFAELPVGDLGLKGTEDPAAIGALLKEKYGLKEPAEGAYSEAVKVVESDAGARVLFTQLNLPSDSVRSQQYLVEVFYPAATASGVTGFGVRRQCWRGANPGAWTKDLCP